MIEADKTFLPRTRAEAKAAGGKRYFTGKPCVNGHVDWRYVGDGQCSQCARIKSLIRFYDNRIERGIKAREYLRNRYANDPEYRDGRKDYQKAYRSKTLNAEKIKDREQKRRDSRTDEERLQQREYMREYQRMRHQASPQARINRSMAGGIYKSITDGAKANRRWEEIVGYTKDDLMSHLGRLFLPGMTWENYGKNGWHIDHKIPKVSFSYDTTDDPQFKECWSLSNLQPLWWRDNISKGAKHNANNNETVTTKEVA